MWSRTLDKRSRELFPRGVVRGNAPYVFGLKISKTLVLRYMALPFLARQCLALMPNGSEERNLSVA